MSLAPLYLKAVASVLGPRASTVPATVLQEDVVVDRAHLAAYARVCGFAVGDALPPTYPHVLGFGLHVRLMAGRSFPLPLPGLVHVRNTIEMHRPIDAAEPLDVQVHAEGLRAHPKGAQVDLVAEVTVAGGPVWTGRSTYLSRGAPLPASRDEMAPESHPAPASRGLGALVSRPAGDRAEPIAFADGPPTGVWRVDAGTGRRYAAVSGDVNPIHLHPLTAKAFGFPRAIAHGMWTSARALAALQGRLPGALTYDVAFARPLLLPSTVELRTRRSGDGWRIDVRSARAAHLAATVAAA